MTRIASINSSLNHIIDLGESAKRIRKTCHAAQMSLIRKIVLFFKDVFCGGCKKTDIEEYNRYKKAINREVRWLQKYQNDAKGGSDVYFLRMRRILHVKAKMDYTGWSNSLKDIQLFKTFETAVGALQKNAAALVDQWVADDSTKISRENKHSISRWIKADPLQLKFSGYSNEIVYKAEEVPVGAVLLNNSPAYLASNRMRGFRLTLQQRFDVIRNFFCRIFTGLPLIHAVAALGGGRFIHVAKDNEATGEHVGMCKGLPMLEDLSNAARAKQKKEPKYMFGYEIMVPNYERMAKELGKEPQEVMAMIQKDWTATLLSSQKHPKTSFWNMIGTILNSKRPEKYDITKVFELNPRKGYSCSGLISAAFARHGIDVVKASRKRIEKAAPADFAKSPLFDILYSNDRQKLLRFRAPAK